MAIRKELIFANLLLLNVILGINLVTSLLPVYLNTINISLGSIGIIFAVGAILAGFLRIPIGVCVDYLGRRKFVLLGAIGYPIFAIGAALSKTTLHFIGLDIILELFGAIFWTAFSAYYFDILRKGREGIEIAERNIVMYAGTAVAPFIAGIIAENLGFTNLFYIGAIISALAIPIAAKKIKDHNKSNGYFAVKSIKDEYKDILKIKGFKIIFAVMFMNNITWTFWAIYMPIFLERNGFSFSQIGLLLSITIIIGAILQIPMGRAIDKFPVKYLLIPGFALVFVGNLIFFSLRNWGSYLIGRSIAGLGWDASYRPAVGLFAKVTPKKEHGAGWGALMAGVSISYGVGALAGGFLTENLGIERVLYYSALASLISGVVFMFSKFLSQKGQKYYDKHHIVHISNHRHK